MEFEWDNIKNARNLKEHGLDFKDADSFDWDDARYFTDDRKDYKEERIFGVGNYGSRLTVIVFTNRNGKTRLISWRKANKREVQKYG